MSVQSRETMNSEDNDALWKLLGEAKKPAVSPFFSRNVLREIRASDQEGPGFISRVAAYLRGTARWPAVACAALLLCLSVAGVRKWEMEDSRAASAREESKQELLLAQQLAKNPDTEVIKHLDELLAFEDNAVWPDSQAK